MLVIVERGAWSVERGAWKNSLLALLCKSFIFFFALRSSLFALRSSRFALRASLFALRASRFALRASPAVLVYKNLPNNKMPGGILSRWRLVRLPFVLMLFLYKLSTFINQKGQQPILS
ncbi:MAG: hypothetical protein KDI38_06725 [Calditrichaeota bacterium]|nr:hypothetical protein [Calditrichota bacterium]